MGALTAGRYGMAIAMVALAACSGDVTGPVGGALEVTASITGSGSDPDGFLVVVGRSTQRRLAPGALVLLGEIPPGERDVALEGIGPNCEAVGSAIQSVTIVAGDTARIAFEVACGMAAGTLQVTVQTIGSDLDPGGYDVMVDGQRVAAVDPDGATLVSIPAGDHSIALDGVNPNCAVAEPVSRAVALPIGGLAGLQFEIRCHPGARTGRGHEIAFSSDDPLTGRTTIFVVNDDGSHREPLFPGLADQHMVPSWAPDGNRIAFYQFPGDTLALLIVAEASGVSLEEFPASSLSPIAWSPAGSTLALAPLSLDCIVRLLQLDGSPEQSLDVGCNGYDIFSLAWSPDGTRLAFVAQDESGTQTSSFTYVGITDFAEPGVGPEPAGCEYHNPSQVAWSPDGSRLAVADRGIEVLELASATCTRLTDETSDGSPSWSPDGSRIAFRSDRDGNAEIYVIGADGSNLTRITRDPAVDYAPSWRP